ETVFRIAVETIEDRRKLRHDVGEVKALAPELGVTVRAEPGESVELVLEPLPLDHEAHGAGGPLGRMRDFRRKQEDIALADRDVYGLPLLEDSQHDVAPYL